MNAVQINPMSSGQWMIMPQIFEGVLGFLFRWQEILSMASSYSQHARHDSCSLWRAGSCYRCPENLVIVQEPMHSLQERENKIASIWCWKFLDWRLTSENDLRLHGQPSNASFNNRDRAEERIPLDCRSRKEWN